MAETKELAGLEKQLKQFRFVLITTWEEIAYESVLEIAKSVGEVKEVLMSDGNECFLALVEYHGPIDLVDLDLPEGLDGMLEWGSVEEFKKKKAPRHGVDYGRWRYGEEKFDAVMEKLDLFPINYENANATIDNGEGVCCVCGEIANALKSPFYKFDMAHKYIVCVDTMFVTSGCRKILQTKFEAEGIEIPTKKFMVV
ncbi:MAG: hypothetical protein Hyperionvirus11_20 [Hyperionvirus sp.]|uniref:Uncharacterized protein n=1 Tax=Hyperionvirus sp. TaxID=2487770 RepID=A0A3G5A909_9VIRU|nr:MAG: hypothetical protein Hyperionvirus11_20 [Hyperionvirus sp.]